MDERSKPQHLGFKIVTVENVLETDPVIASMVVMNHTTGEVREQGPQDWIPLIMGVALDDQVPQEVRRSFAFAQGAMCYAHWYYPLLTLISHDLLRVADFATVEACRQRGIKAKTFKERIAALTVAGGIALTDEPVWTNIRSHRNHATHPTAQSIYSLGMAYKILTVVQTLINRIQWAASPSA